MTTPVDRDQNPEYWQDYTNLQHTKHRLIREYLNGWFPKLGLRHGRILYLDTHAGKGRYRTGQIGSPLVAVEALLGHSARDRILRGGEVRFIFIEGDEANLEALNHEIEDLGALPPEVQIDLGHGDCFKRLEEALAAFDTSKTKMAPAFVFIDPYGFKVPAQVLRRLLAAGRVEIFVNIIWRELDMAIAGARESEDGSMGSVLNEIFGGDQWRMISGDVSQVERADRAVDLLRQAYGARWATSIRMLGKNGATRYLLVHFTNSDAGRDLMKDCMWKVCPDGDFYARRSDNPDQSTFLTAQPDLTDLEAWLIRQLRDGPLRWSELNCRLREEMWRKSQLAPIIRSRRRNGSLKASSYEGKFSEKANPLLSLSPPKET